MGEIARKPLELLPEDAPPSVAQPTHRVGLSTTPCWRRVRTLEVSGVVARRVAQWRRSGWGRPSVFVAIEAGDRTPTWMRRSANAVSAMPEVMEVRRMAGEVDDMPRVAAAGRAEFDAFYKRLIEAVPMRDVTSRFAMERLKHTTADPEQPGVFRARRASEEAAEAA